MILKDNKILPKGTYDLKDHSTLQEYKLILSYPLSEYLTFPSKLDYFPCIIVMQSVQGQQPIYHLYYQILKKRLLSAQKQPNNIGCNYIISKKQKPKKDQYFVGKLRGNFRNNEFIVYDCGQNPKRKCVKKRRQFAFVKFNEESMFQETQQQISVFVPEIQQTMESSQQYPRYHPCEFIPQDQKQNKLLQQYKRNSSRVIKLNSNKTTKKSIKSVSQTYSKILNNIQQKLSVNLVDSTNQKVINFSSRGKTTYRLDIGYPLNMLQGFATALSVIQHSKS